MRAYETQDSEPSKFSGICEGPQNGDDRKQTKTGLIELSFRLRESEIKLFHKEWQKMRKIS